MSRYYVTSTVFMLLILLSLAVDGIFNVPVIWYVVLLIAYVVIVVIGVCVPSASFFVEVRSRGASTGIALTFDDGPVPGKTDQILDVLKEYNVNAAFFCIGNRVDDSPQLVRRMYDEGHLVGNHSYWHGRFFNLKSAPMVTRELHQTDLAISRVIGKMPRFFRPPYGVTNPMIAKALKRLDHAVIGWSIRSFDSVTNDHERLFRRVTGQLKDGDIILLHDYSEATVKILPRIIDHISQRGLKIVRVDELLNEKPYAK